VIVNVVVCTVPVLFVSVPVIVAPPPLAAIPVRLTVLSLIQLNVVPASALGFVIVMVPIAVPEHRVCVAGVALTVGFGLTVTLTVVVEVQVPAVAVIVNVVVCGVVVLFVSVPVMAAPEPLAAIPVRLTVFVLAQLKIVPATALGFVISI